MPSIQEHPDGATAFRPSGPHDEAAEGPWFVMDPGEMRNLAGTDAYPDVEAELAAALEQWMRDTEDPLLDGPVAPPPGATVNDPAGRSAVEPFLEAVD